MKTYRIRFEVRRMGSIEVFTWGVGVDVTAKSRIDAIVLARQELNANGFEVRAGEVEEVE